MRSIRLITSLLMFTLLLGAFAGCNRTKAPYRVSEDPYGPGQVNIADKRLSNILRFEQARLTYDEADLLHVALPVRAATSRTQIIQYRTHFFDRTGQELYTSAWRTETLESNVTQTLSATATTPQAQGFQMDIREAQ